MFEDVTKVFPIAEISISSDRQDKAKTRPPQAGAEGILWRSTLRQMRHLALRPAGERYSYIYLGFVRLTSVLIAFGRL